MLLTAAELLTGQVDKREQSARVIRIFPCVAITVARCGAT